MSTSSSAVAEPELTGLRAGVSKQALMGATWGLVGYALALGVVRLQVSTRSWRRKPDFSDYFLGLALLFYIFQCTMATWIIYNRPDDHHINLDFVRKYEIVADAYIFTFWLAIFSVKASFLVFYYPMFTSMPGRSKICFWMVVAFNISCFLGIVLVQLFICYPFERLWNLMDHCEPFYTSDWNTSVTVLNLLSDLTIVFLPLFLFRQLRHFGRREKAGVLLVLLMGLMSITASLIRFAVVTEVLQNYTIQHAISLTTTMILLAVEWVAAFTAASLPAFKTWLRASNWSSWSSSRGEKSTGISSSGGRSSGLLLPGGKGSKHPPAFVTPDVDLEQFPSGPSAEWPLNEHEGRHYKSRTGSNF